MSEVSKDNENMHKGWIKDTENLPEGQLNEDEYDNEIKNLHICLSDVEDNIIGGMNDKTILEGWKDKTGSLRCCRSPHGWNITFFQKAGIIKRT